jgi:predicted nucleic acid-binding protein
VPERQPRGLLDTSVVIDLDILDSALLPEELAVSAITMAELATGPHATADPDERARRQDRVQRAEATFDPLAFDAKAARSYGRIYAAVARKWSQGSRPTGRRPPDRSRRGGQRPSALHPEPGRLRGCGLASQRNHHLTAQAGC